MAHATEPGKTDVIDGLKQLIKARWPKERAAEVCRFIEQYYKGAAPEDLLQRQLEDMYGTAISHWQLLKRHHEKPLIHVYNPNAEQHGWESTHTVVQVVQQDMPFLVDSLSMALTRLGLTIHLIIHPVVDCPLQGDESGARCACMHFEIDRQTEPETLETIEQELRKVLADVARAVADWQPMSEQLKRALGSLRRHPPSVAKSELAEIDAFLEWLADNHFTFLGYRRYDLKHRGGETRLEVVDKTGLGILRECKKGEASRSFAALPEEVRLQALQADPLLLTKSSSRSSVHRPGYMDYIGIKRFNAAGEVIGEHRFLGLYTSAAYNRNPSSIPLLRRKVEYVLKKAALPPRSHAGKALLNILETYPRDELFQIDPDQLHAIAMGILHLQERQRVRLFVRYDNFMRFASCLVYAPRERYNTEVRHRMEHILSKALGSEQSEFNIYLSESVLARIHFIMHLPSPKRPDIDAKALEAQLAQALRSWNDDYHQALLEHFGEELGNRLFNRYRNAYTAAYREDTTPRTAAHDTERLEGLSEDDCLDMSLYQPLESGNDVLRFKLFHCGRAVALSDVLPMLENMGVQVIDERPYAVQNGLANAWIHDFGLRYDSHGELDAERIREAFQQAFAAVWHQHVEDDGFNRLVLAAGLNYRDIVILRAYCKYLRQAGTSFSQSYIEETLAAYPAITRALIELFYAYQDPHKRDTKKAEALVEDIESALNEVPSLDEDRILRRYLAVISATMRSNYFQRSPSGKPKSYLSFKLQPATIPELPKPHPLFEVFVYAPRFEAVHLRGGRVARGGIRWSDRREDFRTEVLGLMKAQMVKNSVIVPVGAKGGFVLKKPPQDDRDALQEEVRYCYSQFIRGMLDLTDNRIDDRLVGPVDVVRPDGDDPYLVVAADKGTATFSDLANDVAAEYDFWLRDAFASGGSSGYDHKKMGITARGGWEAVKRHFRELGVDIQNGAFTTVGIGDMSGDVFGNAMLLSRHTRLLAAFDHRHIFIDPDPDPELSFKERQRLFALPRSSWEDYDSNKISKGGGVYSRHAKSVTLSEAARKALGIKEERLSANALMQAILRAPVDLVWNGGIGTFIKSSDESDADVGDKANDATRVDGRELRCRVVGEGGNLGVTQLGRIEFAMNGGRINTDAIDNAGGVDCSDHEVNIKILLNDVMNAGDITLKQRNELLASMTDEVSALVLKNNYRQTEALSLCEARAPELLEQHARFIRMLEKAGQLERALEDLPDDEALAERTAAGQGLSRPELAVLLAYAKIGNYSTLLEHELIDDPYLQRGLLAYFPTPLRERYAETIRQHRLRAEIIATLLTNHIVNRMGSHFFFRLEEKLGADAGAVARAYLIGRDVFGLDEYWTQVEALDGKISAQLQQKLLLELSELQERATAWLLRNLAEPEPIDNAVATLQPAVESLRQQLPKLLPETDAEQLKERATRLTEQGVPKGLAQELAALASLYPALDIVKVCGEHNAPLECASSIYFRAATALELNWLREQVARFDSTDPWQERARAGLEDETYSQLRVLTGAILSHGGDAAAQAQVEQWLERHGPLVDRLLQTVAELRFAANVDLAMLTVAVQEVTALAQTGSLEQLGTDTVQ